MYHMPLWRHGIRVVEDPPLALIVGRNFIDVGKIGET